ncbi:vanadium-dependent haloperoxidase, partial [Streptomyces sp. URMC 123]
LNLYKGQASFLGLKFRERFGTAPPSEDIHLDVWAVNPMVTQMMDARNLDGSENRDVYTADGKPGAWRPTSYPDMVDPTCERDSQAVSPLWGKVKPFALTSGAQFRPATPGLYGTYERLLASDEYKAQVEAVRAAGADAPTARTPTVNRTLDQEAAAWFWANDLDGTYKPPGQLLEATRLVSEAQGL